MATINVLKIDENKSHFSDSNPHYVLVLSGKPNPNWKSNLASLFEQSKNRQLMNLRIESNPGNELTLNTTKDVNPEQMLETIQNLITKVNEEEDNFKNKIIELNKKIAEPKA